MLGDGGLCKRQLVDELPAVASIPREKQAQNPNTGWVAQRFGEQGQLLIAPNDRWSIRGGAHRAAAEWCRRAAAMPAGTPRSDFTCGIVCGQPKVVAPTRYSLASIK